MLLFAQEAAGGGASEPNFMGSLLMFVPIIALFYFLIIMPARKKQKKHQEMISNLQVGERVVTAGGIFGTIARVLEDRMEIEIAKGTKIQVTKNSISDIIKPQQDSEKSDK